MNDSNDSNERPYALTCDPPCYTETEMKIVRMEITRLHDELDTVRTEFNDYRRKIEDRGWNAKRILDELTMNVETMRLLHRLCDNNAVFSEGYNNARVSEVLSLLTEDNTTKLHNLQFPPENNEEVGEDPPIDKSRRSGRGIQH